MEEQMERRPLILYETIEMLYKYINGISFHDIAESMSRLYGDVFPGVFVQKLDCLERITQEVCGGAGGFYGHNVRPGRYPWGQRGGNARPGLHRSGVRRGRLYPERTPGPGCHCEFLGHLVYPLLRGASLL